jgi:putative DNA methylase
MPRSTPVAVKSPRKLIEVALPLDKINAAAAREKSIRHGHPSTLHLWWARRPLAAARAVLFAQLVNDPGYERHLNRGVNKIEAAKERERLFKIIEDLVIWENTNNEAILSAARAEIWKSWRETCELNRNHPDAATLFNPEKLPAFHDPFAGGGAIPLEAQRLGLESYASDLNPVAVTINKAMIEIPPRFAGRKPIGPIPPGERDSSLSRADWPGASGLAEDVRRYGEWMRAEAERRIGDLYPKVEITPAMAAERSDLKPLVGHSLTVIAWLWARTVKSPNPAYSHVDVPLVSTFVLSSATGKQAYVQPVVEGDRYRFEVKMGKPPEGLDEGTRIAVGSFRCILSGTPMRYEYIDAEANAGRLNTKLMGIVVQGVRSRIYLSPVAVQEDGAEAVSPEWAPRTPSRGTFASNAQGRIYGFKTFADYFTPRQLASLVAITDIADHARTICEQDALLSGWSTDQRPLEQGGNGPLAYSQAVSCYLAFAVDRVAMTGNSLVRWNSTGQKAQHCFGMPAIPMLWDFAEPNLLADSTGSLSSALFYSHDPLSGLPATQSAGVASQVEAQTQTLSLGKVVSTDPPYYNNVAYADLSDFFYVWMRKLLAPVFPQMFSTIAVPKAEELVASQYRQGSKIDAEKFFLKGMSEAIHELATQAHPAFPVTIYYAVKQADGQTKDGMTNSGWETFLEAVLGAGFSLTGTWPVRTEMRTRQVAMESNALASSIILVCRKRDSDTPSISRREFLRELHSVLPDALVDMTRGGVNSPVAPVDLSQAIIGPGMGIFSKYKAVLEADGKPMTVRTALQLINRFLADDEFDAGTQFCLQWFETNYWKAGVYGSADVAARAKGTDVGSLHRDGILWSGSGEVQLLRWTDLSDTWIPDRNNLTPVWQALHQLILTLNRRGEQAAGALLARMPALSGPIRTLSYRLYTLCERKGLAEDARPYNELIGAWAAIELASNEIGPVETQAELF